MYGYVYLTTNLLNGRKYIGQHKSEIFDESYKGSGKILKQAIEKYGFENFSCEILSTANSKEELNELEKLHIETADAVNSDDYYNLKPGGIGNSESGLTYITNGTVNKKVKGDELTYWLSNGFVVGGPIPSREVAEKRAKSHIGKKYKHSENYLKNGSANLGRPLSESAKKKMRFAKLGKPSPKRKKVLCVETGVIYDCLKDAVLSTGHSATGNLCVAINSGKVLYGYNWKYVD